MSNRRGEMSNRCSGGQCCARLRTVVVRLPTLGRSRDGASDKLAGRKITNSEDPMSPLTLTLESQSDYAILSEPVRDAVLEICDRLERIRAARPAIEPTWDAGSGVDDDA